MTLEEYRGALDRTLPPPDLKGRIRRALETPPARPRRRALLAALAALAAAACLLTAALAASPEFRAAVLTFFRLEEPEQVPGPDTITEDSPVAVGPGANGPVEAQYIRLEGPGWQVWDGLLGQFDGGALLNDQFYTVDDSGLVEVTTQIAEVDAVWDGTEFHLALPWARLDDRVVCYGSGTSADGTHTAGLTAIPGRTDVVELTWSDTRPGRPRSYPMLYHLDTGEITDIFAPYDRAWVEQAGEKWLSPDLKHAIIRDDSGCYLARLEAGTLMPLAELTGWEVEPGTNVCFADDHTLLITCWDRMEGRVYSWSYDLERGTLTQTVDGEDLTLYWGSSGLSARGWLYGLDISSGGGVTVVQLSTGARAAVEGFTCAEEGFFEINADGDKLLYQVSAYGEDHLGFQGHSQLGVLDLEKGVFTLLDRENYAALREGSLGWFVNDRVAIAAHGADSHEDFYLYLYRF